MNCERCPHEGPDVKPVLVHMKAIGYPTPMFDDTLALCMECVTEMRDAIEILLGPMGRPGVTKEEGATP